MGKKNQLATNGMWNKISANWKCALVGKTFFIYFVSVNQVNSIVSPPTLIDVTSIVVLFQTAE